MDYCFEGKKKLKMFVCTQQKMENYEALNFIFVCVVQKSVISAISTFYLRIKLLKCTSQKIPSDFIEFLN